MGLIAKSKSMVDILDAVQKMAGHEGIKSQLKKKLEEFFKPKTETEKKAVDEVADKLATQQQDISDTLEAKGLSHDKEAFRTELKDTSPQRMDWLEKCNEQMSSKKNHKELEKFEREYYEEKNDKKEQQLDKEEQYEQNLETIEKHEGKNFDRDAWDPTSADLRATEIKNELEAVNKAKDAVTQQPEMSEQALEAAKLAAENIGEAGAAQTALTLAAL